MESEAQCKNCGHTLGQMSGLWTFAALLRACQVTREKLDFQVQCPKCGKLNHIKTEY